MDKAETFESIKRTYILSKTAAISLFAAVLILTGSCIDNTVIHEYKHIDSDGWGRTDTLSYIIPKTKHYHGNFAFSTELRTTNSFDLQGVWIVRKLILHNPEHTATDSIYVNTTNAGFLPTGTGISLTTFSHTDTLNILKPGQYGTLQLYHVMTAEYLTNIQDVGAKIIRCD